MEESHVQEVMKVSEELLYWYIRSSRPLSRLLPIDSSVISADQDRLRDLHAERCKYSHTSYIYSNNTIHLLSSPTSAPAANLNLSRKETARQIVSN